MTFTAQPVRQTTRPTWAEISLSALRHNFRIVQRHVGAPVTVCAVVKADAYGHGAPQCARALEAEGASWFAVTCTDEGIALRDAGIRSRILLMTGFWPGEEADLIRQKLTPVLWEPWQVDLLDRAAAQLNVRPQPVHLKVDTGMTRLGVSLGGLPALCRSLQSASHLSLEGIASHFASSDVLDAPDVEPQTRHFEEGLRMVTAQGFSPSFCHMANSGAIVSRPDSWKNMVRPGISLYGYYLPFQRSGKAAPDVRALDVKPVLSWKTRVLSVKDVPAGERLGYSGTYTTREPSRMAVLPVGYADGLNRQLSSRGRVIIRGHYAPIVGRISMDLTLVDVTGVPGVDPGDEVILIGSNGDLSISAWEHAQLASTIPYEVLCAISRRVRRQYAD